jgi:dephospho-CoA kinase
MIIGLTGGIGSGKSAAANFFTINGIDVIQADSIANNALNKGSIGYIKFIEIFGDSFFDNNDNIDKSSLRKIIFTDPDLKKSLEQIIHPIVKESISKLIISSKSPYQIIEVPLIFETNSQESYDRILVIDCDEALQIQRTIKRDTSNENDIKNILSNQASRIQRLSISDDVIINNSNLEHLKNEVNNMHKFYLNLVKDQI